MPKQQFEVLDYAAPLFVGAAFAVIVFMLTFVINFAFIRRTDEVTAFEKLGAKYNLRVGPHRVSLVKEKMEKHVDEDGHEY
ncbi:DUF3149 domain-containing protein [Caenorhabditis elegans]|uniref:DUF3149 domain-containing protein n=1 Tax=Caenorhabditis elegans TaxID=6239 RepID=Q21914_CAEEL|nr:DUF3149 domain-containing protein [Caenorhabditis elegans]CAA94608.1 DUF3149 domain-containing protein [Caenorhabditis elegans]|eukprot:NP_501920.1 Uncharacterized protein CELE_R10H10.4 [Caenorhabditis elegans]